MSKSYTVQEVKKLLAKHLRDMVDRYAGDIKDMHKRELFKASVMQSAHPEPGQHEPAEVGVPEHMEPGQHEQFAIDPPAGPDAGQAQPVTGGIGVPEAQLQNPEAQPSAPGDLCPLCGQPDRPGSCTCLDNVLLGKAALPMNMGPAGAAAPPTPVAPMGTNVGAGGPGAPMSLSEKGLDRETVFRERHEKEQEEKRKLDEKKMWADHNKQAQAKRNTGFQTQKGEPGEMCKNCGKPMHKAGEACMGKAEGLPGEKTKEISNDGSGTVLDPKGNPLGKVAVPEAKPPSGKNPGTAAPPIASTTSKPALGKDEMYKSAPPGFSEEEMHKLKAQYPGEPEKAFATAWMIHNKKTKKGEDLDKAVLPAGAKKDMHAQAMNDSFRASVGAGPKLGGAAAMAPATGKPTLTSPNDPTRANHFQAAAAGAFQPPGGKPEPSGLELARPVKPAPGLKLTPPPAGMRPGAGPAMTKPSPFGKGEEDLPKHPSEYPVILQPTLSGQLARTAAMGVVLTIPALLGHVAQHYAPKKDVTAQAPAPAPAPDAGAAKPFGKSELCPFCRKSEHMGDCTKK